MCVLLRLVRVGFSGCRSVCRFYRLSFDAFSAPSLFVLVSSDVLLGRSRCCYCCVVRAFLQHFCALCLLRIVLVATARRLSRDISTRRSTCRHYRFIALLLRPSLLSVCCCCVVRSFRQHSPAAFASCIVLQCFWLPFNSLFLAVACVHVHARLSSIAHRIRLAQLLLVRVLIFLCEISSNTSSFLVACCPRSRRCVAVLPLLIIRRAVLRVVAPPVVTAGLSPVPFILCCCLLVAVIMLC